MKLTPINSNMSFKARLERNIGPKIVNPETQRPILHINDPLNLVLMDYDNAIERIRAQKARAIELDAFMHSDEVTQYIGALPQEDIVSIMYRPRNNEDLSEYNILLRYIPGNSISYTRTQYRDYKDPRLDMKAQNKDGSINKQGIIGWLTDLKHFFD